MTIDPAPYQSTVELMLATTGTMVDVFQDYEVALSMLDAGNPWTFLLFRSEARQATWDVVNRSVKALDSIVVMIDDATQLTGRVEVRDTQADHAQGARILINGRDLAGPAMDYDTDPTLTITNMQLGEALPQVFGTIGLPCRVVDSAANAQVNAHEAPGPRRTNTAARRRAVVDLAHPRPGEKVWSFAAGIALRVGLLLWVAPDAERGLAVVADVPNNNGAPAYVLFRRAIPESIAYEGNILAGGEKINARNAPTSVTVYSGTKRGNLISARGRSETHNVALSDPAVTRGLVLDPPPVQPRHVKSDRARTPQRAAQEGANAILEAMRDFRTYTCTVKGHGQTVDGSRRLYAINTVARVRDDVCVDSELRPLDEDMLIVKVTFKGSHNGGQTTELTLVPLGALAIVPTEATT